MARSGVAAYMGFEKEPPKHHPRKAGGKVIVHSHGMKPKHKISPRKRGMTK